MRKKWYVELYEQGNNKPLVAKEVECFADVRVIVHESRAANVGQIVRIGVPDTATNDELREIQAFGAERL
jgi:hypothetical protein